jgi:alkylhydroperoxidase family enzyme
MSWVTSVPHAPSPIEGLLGWRPELLEQFRSFYGTLWDERLLDPALLEMLRLRIAQIHDCSAELAIVHSETGLSESKRAALADWRKSDLFDPRERVLLGYAEHIPFDHHLIEDNDAAAVRDALGEKGFVAYSLAVTLFDALCRLRIVMQLDASASDPALPPASAKAMLR